jgi:3-keto-5-aminohexanoate cleavage enzyme
MDKLIITCATAWEGYDGVAGIDIPKTAEAISDSVRAACDAGAAVMHVHPPVTPGEQGPPGFDGDAWLAVARLVRRKSNIVFEHGLGGMPYIVYEFPGMPADKKNRTYDIGAEKPELISLILNEVDFCWSGRNFYLMPTRDNLQKYSLMCREKGVKPSFEVWHSGSFWNLQWLIDKGVVDPPFWLTLFFGANGGMSGPPVIEELLYRVKSVPKEGLWQVSTFCGVKGSTTTEQQLALVSTAIALGGHVRVGMEDNPYYSDGVPARSNAQLVERVVRIAREMGREIATPDEARRALGLPRVA